MTLDLNWTSNMYRVVSTESVKGFTYTELPWRFQASWQDGVWSDGELIADPVIHLAEGATSLHYAQQCFEGIEHTVTAYGDCGNQWVAALGTNRFQIGIAAHPR